MADETATVTRLSILLRSVDGEVLVAEARQRKQSLGQFAREILEVAAADARHGPVAQLSWLDVYSRHARSQLPEEDDPEIRYSPSRPTRPPRLP